MRDYGPLGRKYPVRPGEIWRAGRHVFLCGSMFNLEPPLRPSLVYDDPPWDQGLYKSFHTHAGLPAPTHPWTDLYLRIVQLAAGAPCFIEGSGAQRETVAKLLDGQGKVYAWWPIWSAFRRTCVLHYIGPALPRNLDLSFMEDPDTPGAVMQRYPQGIVLDPCCGLGFTSRAAEGAAWDSINFELHPRRMSRAMAQLKIPAERVIKEGSTP